MADETIKKILDFDVKLNDADAKILATARAIEDAEKELKLFNETRKLNIKLTDEQILQEAELKVKLQANKEEYRALTNIQKQKALADKAEIGSIDQLNKLYKAAESELKRLGGQYTRNKDGSIQLTNAHANERAEVKQLFEQLKAYDAGLSNHRLNVGNYTNSITGLETQLAALRDEIKTLDLGSKEFTETKKKIDDVSFSLQVATGKIDELGNREAKNKLREGFQDAQQSTQALTQSLTLLSVAFKNNENAGAAINKVIQAISVAQTALVVIQAKKSIQDTLDIAKTSIKTAGEKVYAMVVGETTGALKAARLAAAALTAVGIIFFLYEAAKAMGIFGSSTDDATADIEAQNKALEEHKQRLIDDNALTSAGQKETVKRLEREIELREAQGASEYELFKLRKELINKQIQIEREYRALFDEGTQDRIESTEKINDLLNQQAVNEATYTNKLRDETSKRIKILRDQQNALANPIETQNNFNVTNSEEDEINALLKLLGININVADIPDYIDKLGEGVLKPAKEKLEPYQISILPEDEQFQKDLELFRDVSVKFAEDLGQLFAESLTETGLDLEKFYKGVTTLILSNLEKVLLASQFELLSGDLVKLGFAGIATAAAKIALITAAFESAKALINKPSESAFYEGGEVDVAGDKNVKDGTVWQNQYGQRIKTHAGEKMFVLNPSASDEYRKLSWLSSFNQAFGGRGMKGSYNSLYDGGIANTNVINKMGAGFDYNKFAEAIMRNGSPKLIFKDFDIAYKNYRNSEGLVKL